MNARARAWITAATGGTLLLAAVLSQVGLQQHTEPLLVGSAIVAGFPTAFRAIQSLRSRAFSIELLVSIAVVGALCIGEFVEAAVVSFLFIFGAWLEARTLEKTRRSLRELMDLTPPDARVLRDGATITVGIGELVEGDHVVVASGGRIAVDGTILSGHAFINEATITGEPTAASKAVGDTVYSGTIVENGYLEVLADRVGDDTTVARIIELVEEAQETKTTAQRFLDRFARIYTPAIVVLALLVLVVARDIEFALTFLVIACPGALVISTPVSMVAGLGNGARHGVLMKGGSALERLSKLDTIVFDKTGTLTVGRPEITEIRTTGTVDDAELLALAAALESASEHPLGRTIVQAAAARGLHVERPRNVEVLPGAGIRGTVGQNELLIGSRRVLDEMSVELTSELAGYALERELSGNTVVHVTIGGVLAGVISVADSVRPEARAAIAELRANGIKEFAMLTGDNPRTARLVADHLGIETVYAELLPDAKAQAIRDLQARGRRVGMVGDGINDAPALATADVGIAMGSGTDVSVDTADAILVGNRFDQLVHAVALARATVANMRQNMVIAIGTVVALLAGVLLQQVFMATGMLIHEISVLLVILNAVRLVRYRQRDRRRQAPSTAEPLTVGPRPARQRWRVSRSVVPIGAQPLRTGELEVPRRPRRSRVR